MIPTKVRDIIPRAAEHIGIPEDHLANIMSFYYKENKKLLSTLSHTHILLRGLGSMNIKGWELEEEISDMRKVMEKSTKPENIEALKLQIRIFTDARERWLAERAEKKRVSELKKIYYATKTNDNELEGKTTTGMGQ